MDLVSKYELIEKIVHTDNEVILHQIKNLLDEEEAESWEDLDSALKASIERGIEQSERREGTPHEKVMKELRKKYSSKK